MTTRINQYPAFDLEMLSDESKMVISFARKTISDRPAAELGENTVNWAEVKALADSYKVSHLIYGNLGDSFPDEVADLFRTRAGTILSRNTKDIANIKMLAVLFAKEGIDIIFLKGAALLVDVYVSPGFRDFSDIDILVREQDTGKIESVLTGNGFHPVENEGDFPRYRSQKVFMDEDGLVLDVHVDLIGRRVHNRLLGLDIDKIWRNKRYVDLSGTKIYLMDLAHDLVYQCLHLSMNHSFSGVRWYVDINEFILKHSKEIDWDGFMTLVRKYRVRRPVYYAFLFTTNMFDTPVPERVMGELSKIKRGLDLWTFKKIRNNDRGTDYLAELAMFDTMWDTLKFTTLSFVSQPKQFTHFCRITGRVIKEIFTQKTKTGKE